MYKAKITSVEKVRHQATNTDFLEVIFDIIDKEEKVVATKQIGLNVQSTKKDVILAVNGHVVEYGRELANAKIEAEKAKANANVKDMQKTLVGKTVGSEASQDKVVEGGGDE